MRLPRLTRTLTLEAPVRTQDGAGGHDTTWVAQGTLFAEVKPGSGRQAAGLAAPLSRLNCRVIVRAAPEGAPSRPVAGQRFREGTRVYRIDSVAAYDRAAHYLTCFAVEETVV